MSYFKFYKMNIKYTFFSFASTIFRGIIIGFKAIVLFYVVLILSWLIGGELDILIALILGFANGFIDALVISVKIKTKYKIISKIFSCIIGLIATFFVYILSLRIYLPHILVDYFVYGEDGGGLEAGGWLAFTVLLIIYSGISILISFPIAMFIFSRINNRTRDNVA